MKQPSWLRWRTQERASLRKTRWTSSVSMGLRKDTNGNRRDGCGFLPQLSIPSRDDGNDYRKFSAGTTQTSLDLRQRVEQPHPRKRRRSAFTISNPHRPIYPYLGKGVPLRGYDFRLGWHSARAVTPEEFSLTGPVLSPFTVVR